LENPFKKKKKDLIHLFERMRERARAAGRKGKGRLRAGWEPEKG